MARRRPRVSGRRDHLRHATGGGRRGTCGARARRRRPAHDDFLVREMTTMTTTMLCRSAATLAAALSTVLALGACNRDEAKDQAAEGGEPAGGAITMWTDSTELFM